MIGHKKKKKTRRVPQWKRSRVRLGERWLDCVEENWKDGGLDMSSEGIAAGEGHFQEMKGVCLSIGVNKRELLTTID